MNTIKYRNILCPILKQYNGEFNDCFKILYKNEIKIIFIESDDIIGDVEYVCFLTGHKKHIFSFYKTYYMSFRRISETILLDIVEDFKSLNPDILY